MRSDPSHGWTTTLTMDQARELYSWMVRQSEPLRGGGEAFLDGLGSYLMDNLSIEDFQALIVEERKTTGTGKTSP